MDIEGLGENIISQLQERNLISNIADIYVRYTKSGLKDNYRTTANILGVNPEYYYEIYNYDAHQIDNYELKQILYNIKDISNGYISKSKIRK